MGVRRTLAWWCLIFISVVLQAAVCQGRDVEAITRPSKDVTLSFVGAGQIAEVLVEEGNVVKAGQVLVRQDDAAEQAQLEQLRAQAEDTTRIKAAEAELRQKEVDRRKIERAAERGAATELEVEHAKLDVTIAELSLALVNFRHRQDQREHRKAEIYVERMRVSSPIDGKVERIFADVGESIDALAEVIRVVKTDPLWIDVPAPLPQTKGLRLGQGAGVEFVGASSAEVEGRIIHIAAVADAASDTLTVRVEAPNASGRPAGEHVRIRFKPPGEAVGMLRSGPEIAESGRKPENKD